MSEAILDKNNIATQAGNITVYNYDSATREYLFSTVEYLAVGVGIPANSCIDAPSKEKEGFAICRTPDFIGWEYIIDHRGEMVYGTVTGEEISVSDLGDYPADTTILAPSTSYDKWDGTN